DELGERAGLRVADHLRVQRAVAQLAARTERHLLRLGADRTALRSARAGNRRAPPRTRAPAWSPGCSSRGRARAPRLAGAPRSAPSASTRGPPPARPRSRPASIG